MSFCDPMLRKSVPWSTIALIACLALVAGTPLAAEAGAREEKAMAQRVSAELKAALALETMPWQEVNALILQERFAEFESLSRSYEEKFKTDPKYESPLTKLYASLDARNDRLWQKLDKWVATRPSYISHGARGIARQKGGDLARGTRYANETAPEQMERMRQMHLQAIPDLLAALKENRRFAPAYESLIDIDRAVGDSASAERVLREAVRWIPETYYVRYAYLTVLRPKWGGDYSLMQAYANSQSEAARLNPRIWSLRAEVPADLGSSAWVSQDYTEAIKYYTEALRYGDRLEFLKKRGQLFWRIGNYAAARRDFARYLEYQADPDVIRWKKTLDQVK